MIDLEMDIDLPEVDELEITTLGPGKSKGESVVVHLQGNDWIIIDSCIAGDEVLPLYYLRSLGVPFDHVKMLICTHWHTDHINGMPKILEMCPNAQLYMASVGSFKGYLNVALKLAGMDTFDSGVWKKLDACLEVLTIGNRPRPKHLNHDQLLFKSDDNTVEFHVLGPSDELIDRFNTSLLRINPDAPSKNDVEKLEGNLCSVAFAINYKGQQVLIGGDMEVGRKGISKYNYHICDADCAPHEECGWCDVKDNSAIYHHCKPYSMVKIPHHSSVTSYCPKMWPHDMIAGRPIATTTVFENGDAENLPTKDMLTLYKSLCSQLYITYSNIQHEEFDITDIVEDGDIEVEDKYVEGIGVVVCRWKEHDANWSVHTYGEGCLVTEEYINNYHI